MFWWRCTACSIRAWNCRHGVALVQRCLVKEALQSGAVVVPFDLPIALQRGYYLCTPHDRRPRPGFGEFRRWLLEAAQEDIQGMAMAGGNGFT